MNDQAGFYFLSGSEFFFVVNTEGDDGGCKKWEMGGTKTAER